MNEYEKAVSKLKHYNSIYDYAYKLSYENHWLKCHNVNRFDVISYRQSLIDKICHNNDLIDDFNFKIEKHINISNLFQRIYFFLNFDLKPFAIKNNNTTFKKRLRRKLKIVNN